MLDHLLRDVRRQELVAPGDRVGLAVSGGADSVALLRLMMEARARLGAVLSVVHFNHKIRGAQAYADEQFVCSLAGEYGLEFIRDAADTPAYAQKQHLSLEAAGRELRYEFFRGLIAAGVLDKVATAHTMDDQAETVLLRVIRGAGTKGMAGIFPRVSVSPARSESVTQSKCGAIIRPLLGVRRAELVAYLHSIGQNWREDASNLDVRFTRNRVRRQLVPLLQREFNPAVVETLHELAEIARAEQEYWDGETLPLIPAASGNQLVFDVQLLCSQPLALRRRLLRAAADRLGVALDFRHIEAIRDLLSGPATMAQKTVELPGGWAAVRAGNSLRLQPAAADLGQQQDYEFRLPIPGEAQLPALGITLRTTVTRADESDGAYNDDQQLDLGLLSPELKVRNWRPGDRFWPVHSKAARKLKELLQERRVGQPEKALWPVALSGREIVWVRGFPVAKRFRAAPGSDAVRISELPILQRR